MARGDATVGAIQGGKVAVAVTLDDSQFVLGTAKVKSSLKKLSAGLNTFSNSVIRTGMALGVPLAAALRQFTEFDHQMRVVRAVTQASEAQFAALTARARELGKTTSWTAREVAEGMTSLGRMGWRPKEIDSAISAMMDLARATDSEVGIVSTLTSNTMRAFKAASSEATHYADILTVAANKSSQTVTDIGEAMTIVGPIAATAGESVEDLAAALMVMANNGVRGSIAGTALRNALTKLNDPLRQKLLDKYNIKVKDAFGNMRKLVDILGDLNRNTQGLGSGDLINLYSELFGLRGMLGGAVITNNINEAADALEAVKSSAGEANRVARGMEESLWGATKIAISAFQDLGIAIGNALTGDLEKTLGKLTMLVRGLSTWVKQNKEQVKQVAKWILECVKFAVELKAVLKFAALTKGVMVFATAFSTLATNIKTAKTAMEGFNAAQVGEIGVGGAGAIVGGAGAAAGRAGATAAGGGALGAAANGAIVATSAKGMVGGGGIGGALRQWRASRQEVAALEKDAAAKASASRLSQVKAALAAREAKTAKNALLMAEKEAARRVAEQKVAQQAAKVAGTGFKSSIRNLRSQLSNLLKLKGLNARQIREAEDIYQRYSKSPRTPFDMVQSLKEAQDAQTRAARLEAAKYGAAHPKTPFDMVQNLAARNRARAELGVAENLRVEAYGHGTMLPRSPQRAAAALAERNRLLKIQERLQDYQASLEGKINDKIARRIAAQEEATRRVMQAGRAAGAAKTEVAIAGRNLASAEAGLAAANKLAATEKAASIGANAALAAGVVARKEAGAGLFAALAGGIGRIAVIAEIITACYALMKIWEKKQSAKLAKIAGEEQRREDLLESSKAARAQIADIDEETGEVTGFKFKDEIEAVRRDMGELLGLREYQRRGKLTDAGRRRMLDLSYRFANGDVEKGQKLYESGNTRDFIAAMQSKMLEVLDVEQEAALQALKFATDYAELNGVDVKGGKRTLAMKIAQDALDEIWDAQAKIESGAGLSVSRTVPFAGTAAPPTGDIEELETSLSDSTRSQYEKAIADLTSRYNEYENAVKEKTDELRRRIASDAMTEDDEKALRAHIESLNQKLAEFGKQIDAQKIKLAGEENLSRVDKLSGAVADAIRQQANSGPGGQQLAQKTQTEWIGRFQNQLSKLWAKLREEQKKSIDIWSEGGTEVTENERARINSISEVFARVAEKLNDLRNLDIGIEAEQTAAASTIGSYKASEVFGQLMGGNKYEEQTAKNTKNAEKVNRQQLAVMQAQNRNLEELIKSSGLVFG